MARIRKVVLAVYLLSGIVVTGALTGSLFGPYTARFAELLARPVARVVVAVCLVIVGIQMIATLIRMIAERPESVSVRLGGNPDIEVSTDAIASTARVAAADRDTMVEDVEAHVTGRERDAVRVRVTAIALIDQGLEGLAFRMQQRVADACSALLGSTPVTVQVRFLPSRTETVTKEVER